MPTMLKWLNLKKAQILGQNFVNFSLSEQNKRPKRKKLERPTISFGLEISVKKRFRNICFANSSVNHFNIFSRTRTKTKLDAQKWWKAMIVVTRSSFDEKANEEVEDNRQRGISGGWLMMSWWDYAISDLVKWLVWLGATLNLPGISHPHPPNPSLQWHWESRHAPFWHLIPFSVWQSAGKKQKKKVKF